MRCQRVILHCEGQCSIMWNLYWQGEGCQPIWWRHRCGQWCRTTKYCQHTIAKIIQLFWWQIFPSPWGTKRRCREETEEIHYGLQGVIPVQSLPWFISLLFSCLFYKIHGFHLSRLFSCLNYQHNASPKIIPLIIMWICHRLIDALK